MVVETARFRPSQRLLGASDYRRVFEGTERKAGQKELLLLARRNSLHHHRLGLAIAKKHVPTAVKRNLIKRLAREIFRTLERGAPAMDIVVLSRPAARTASRSAIRGALIRQFGHLGLTAEHAR